MGPPWYQQPSAVSFGDRGLKMRQQRLPPGLIAVAPLRARSSQPLPATVLDLYPGSGGPLGEEADLHLGGVRPVPSEMPQVGQHLGGLPGCHLAPVMFGAVGRAFIDPAADAALQDDEPGLPGPCVAGRPPRAYLRGDR